jgi:ubiquinone/menaquinone biosynthesis C-methylase UbiE
VKLSAYLDMSAPYTAAQGWCYENIVAPALLPTRWVLEERLLAALPEGARVLDVGAGAGAFAVALAEKRPDLRIQGIDLSPHQVARAERAARHLADRVRFTTGSALDLPFPDGAFDGVMSCGSIKHWPDRARGLAECLRVLAPGGPLVVTEVDRGCAHEDTRSFVARWRMPGLLTPIALTMFRTWVAGQSLDIEEARALAARAPLRDPVVERIPGFPLLFIAGRR